MMTLATILVWMAMRGQAVQPQVGLLPQPLKQSPPCVFGGNVKLTHVTTNCVIETSPPAQHVIEIRTKREHPDREVSDWRECGADDEIVMINKGVNGIFPIACRSSHVTREVWIDGQKWGVLKETEEK